MIKDDLLIRLRKGDAHAFERIYKSFYPKISLYTLRFTRSRAMAEEITQEVFIKLWETRERVDPTLAFDSYLYRIARNHALNVVKRIQIENIVMGQLTHQQTLLGSATDSYLHYVECQTVIDKAIEMLPPKRQEIFRMSKLEYVQHDTIALRLDISKHTIKSQIVKASKFIRKYFQEYYRMPAASIN
jgi:RNA polymerase sigma-70 factor (ECF subfamily)